MRGFDPRVHAVLVGVFALLAFGRATRLGPWTRLGCFAMSLLFAISLGVPIDVRVFVGIAVVITAFIVVFLIRDMNVHGYWRELPRSRTVGRMRETGDSPSRSSCCTLGSLARVWRRTSIRCSRRI
jgi:hypothetical protein